MSAVRSVYPSASEGHRSRTANLIRILTVLAMIGALLFVAPGASAQPPPFDGWVYNPATGHSYKFMVGSWSAVESIAVGYGGHIVTVNDAAEEAWLCSALDVGLVGIGYNDVASEGNFVWVSGETPGYVNWELHEPSGDGDLVQLEGCPSVPGWNDVPAPYAFIVEIPGPVPVAEVSAVDGSATVGGAAAYTNQLVRQGDAVVTSVSSSVTLRTGTSELEAIHEIAEDSQGTVTDNLTLDGFIGQIRTMVSNLGADAYEIRTPVAVIGVRGTDTTTVSTASTTTTRVDEGSVDVSSSDGGETVEVTAGYAVDVDASGVGVPYPTSSSNGPVFGADPVHDIVDGWSGGWGSPVTVTVPGSPLGDYQVTTDPYGSFQVRSEWWPESERFDLVPGTLVTVSDGTTTKTVTISDLVVNPPDGPYLIPAGATTISGTAVEADGMVVVEVHGRDEQRAVTFVGNDWTSEPFSAPLGSGEFGVVTQTELDDGEGAPDQTRIFWRVPNPTLISFPVSQQVHAYEWAAGVGVTLEVAHPDGAGGWSVPFHTETLTSAVTDWDPFLTIVDFSVPEGDPMLPGDLVTVFGDGFTKTHVVIGLSVDVDVDTDVVSGSTDAFGGDEYLDVWVDNGPGRSVMPSGADGSFSLDFWAEFGHDLQPGETGGVNQYDNDGDRTQVNWWIPKEPVFGADPVHEIVEGWDWAPDTDVTVSVPGSPNIDYQTHTDGNGYFQVRSEWLPEDEKFDIAAEMLVTVSAGAATKTLVVSDLVVNPPDGPDSIPVGALDMSGTADPADGAVYVEVHSRGYDKAVAFTGSVDWVSDLFTEPLVRGDHGAVIQIEPDDGEGAPDQTRIFWQVPNPAFTVQPDNDAVWGWQWTNNNTVIVSVFEPDHTTAKWGPQGVAVTANGEFHVDLATESVDVIPNDWVDVTDDASGFTKSHRVIDLMVAVDADADVVSGTTDYYGVGDHYAIDVWENNGPDTSVIPDPSDGSWGVDFAAEFSHDIRLGSNGGASQPDPDGDRTQIDWQIANPVFTVQRDWGDVWGSGWAPGSTVDVWLGDVLSPAGHFTAPVDQDGNFGPNESTPSGFGYPVETGDVVTVFDGASMKETTIADLSIIGVDVDTDTVTGSAGEGSTVWVNIHGSGTDDEPVVADVYDPVSSVWTWNVSFPDRIDRGTAGYTYQPDPDGDTTQVDWRVPNPVFNVEAGNDAVWGHEWTPGELIVSIDGGPSWSTWASDGSDGQNPGDFAIGLQNAEPTWDLQPGDVVTVTHGTASESKSHTVAPITAGWVSGSVVAGTGDDGAVVSVWVDGPNLWRSETATGGVWSADFSVPGDEQGEENFRDLTPGDGGSANQCDPDGDCSFANWRIANPAFKVHRVSGDVFGTDWAPFTEVTALLGDPTSPDDSFTVFTDGWGNFWPQEGMPSSFEPEVISGALVTVSDGTSTKDHVVVSLAVSQPNVDDETVSGSTVPPYLDIRVSIHGGPGATRDTVSDGDGLYSVTSPSPGAVTTSRTSTTSPRTRRVRSTRSTPTGTQRSSSSGRLLRLRSISGLILSMTRSRGGTGRRGGR
jgi:hypothetical protein